MDPSQAGFATSRQWRQNGATTLRRSGSGREWAANKLSLTGKWSRARLPRSGSNSIRPGGASHRRPPKKLTRPEVQCHRTICEPPSRRCASRHCRQRGELFNAKRIFAGTRPGGVRVSPCGQRVDYARLSRVPTSGAAAIGSGTLRRGEPGANRQSVEHV